MGDSLRNLLVKIGFEVDHNPLEKLEHSLEGIHQKLEFLAAAEVVKGLYEMVEKFSHFGEDLAIASKAAGLTVESFQKLSYAADQSGVSTEEMQRGLAILSRRLYGARNGAAQSLEAFARVGFTEEQVKGFHTSQDALYALSDKFQKIKDPIQRAAVAQELLGRGSVRMVGFLGQGSKAIKAQADAAENLGLVLSEDQVEALESVERTFKTFAALLKNITATIASQVAPVFEYMIKDFIQFFGASRGLIEVNVTHWLDNVAFAMGFVWGAIKLVTSAVIALATALGLQDHIFSLVASFASLVAGLLIFKRTVDVILYGVTSIISAFGTLQKIAGFVGVILSNPFVLATAAIAGLIILVHDLFALFNGDQTWVGSFIEWAASLSQVKMVLEVISQLWETLKGGLSSLLKIGGAFTGMSSGVSDDQAPSSKLASFLPGFLGGAPTTQSSSVINQPAAGGMNYNIDAPINVSVPSGTDPTEVGNQVKLGVQDHLDRVFRETRRSTNMAVVY